MNKTLVVWRRLGKEHGEDCGYRVNSQDVINKHINDKIVSFSKTSDSAWRWWQINENLIIETSGNFSQLDKKKSFYYLPHKNWLIIENFSLNWKWYIHIGNMVFDKERNCWIFTDWFSDVIVKSNDVSHSVLDLDELGQALSLGLIDSKQMIEILSSTQELVDSIRNDNFPPKEIKAYL